MLIGNNRIIEVGVNVKAPNPYAEIIDLSNRYLLPGLIHFNCSFLKGDDYKMSNSAIYIALSHGATFLIDTLKLKKDVDCDKTITFAIDTSKPIITDYGLHLRAYSCNRVSSEDMINAVLNEGIPSFFIKMKDLDKMEHDNLDHLFELVANLKLLIICESVGKCQPTTEIEQLISDSNSEKLKMILSIIRKHKCPFLFLWDNKLART
jgi:dihydroorotase-like cyclic amidohydrolase